MVQCSVVFPTINMKATGENIVRLCKERGVKVKDLQHFFGFESPQAIYKWRWGRSLPNVDNLFALSVYLGVPIQDILVSDDQDVAVYGDIVKYPIFYENFAKMLRNDDLCGYFQCPAV